jgi:cyclic pyranopterin phosphate synthase
MDRVAAAFAEIIGHSVVSPHVAPGGGARMVDVAQKGVSEREALAESTVSMSSEAYERLRSNEVPKGDVLGAARVAGILAAKKTPELIPLCHTIALTRVVVELELDDDARSVRITATADANDRTGVEMEALVAASVAALTIYDMLKGIDRAMTIGPTRLVSKSGGRSGDYRR